jgi:hypothetical protein
MFTLGSYIGFSIEHAYIRPKIFGLYAQKPISTTRVSINTWAGYATGLNKQ